MIKRRWSHKTCVYIIVMGKNVITFYGAVCGQWTSNPSKLLSYFCWHYLKMSHPIKKKIIDCHSCHCWQYSKIDGIVRNINLVCFTEYCLEVLHYWYKNTNMQEVFSFPLQQPWPLSSNVNAIKNIKRISTLSAILDLLSISWKIKKHTYLYVAR